MSCIDLLLPYVRWAANEQLTDPNRYVIGVSMVSTNTLGESIFIRGFGDVSSAKFSEDGSRFYITIRGKGRRLTGSTRTHLAASDTNKNQPGTLIDDAKLVDRDSQVIFAIDAISSKVRIRVGDISVRDVTDEVELQCNNDFFSGSTDGDRIYIMSLQYVERKDDGWHLVENPLSTGDEEKPQVEAHVDALETSSEPDDLEKIEGVGPKMKQALNAIEIYTFTDLASYEGDELRTKLEESGVKTGLAFVEFWPAQAALADANRWNALKYIQEALLHSGKPVLADNLQKIYGIGQGIVARLDQMGITTFKQLTETDPEQLENDLREAGAKIAYGTTMTWPEQATLAKDFKWVELEAYQQQLREMHDELYETDNEFESPVEE